MVEILYLLVAAVAAVLIFSRLGLGSVLGYLAAGAVIGPYGFELVTDAVAQCSDARRYFEDLLSASIETLQLEVSLLSSLTVEESSLTYKTQPRSFLLATKKAARIVKELIK